ncbi:hypothetical protein ACWIUH_09140 [Ursidibacter arcticus]
MTTLSPKVASVGNVTSTVPCGLFGVSLFGYALTLGSAGGVLSFV